MVVEPENQPAVGDSPQPALQSEQPQKPRVSHPLKNSRISESTLVGGGFLLTAVAALLNPLLGVTSAVFFGVVALLRSRAGIRQPISQIDSSQIRLSPPTQGDLDKASLKTLYELDSLQIQQTLINRLEELALVEVIAHQLSSAVTFDQIATRMLDIALRVTDADRVTLYTLTETGSSWLVMQRDSIESDVHKTYRTRGREDGIMGAVIRSKQPLVIDDMETTTYTVDVSHGAHYRSLIAVPLISTDAVIGVLTVESKTPGYLKENESGFLMHLAEHTVTSIENTRLLDAHKHQIRVLSSLQSLSQRLSSGLLNRADVEEAVVNTARQMFDALEVAIFHYDPMEKDVYSTQIGSPPHGMPMSLIFPHTMVLNAVRAGEIQVTYHSSPRATSFELDHDELPPMTIVCAPIKHGDGVNAVLCIAFAEQRHLRKRDMDAITLLTAQTGEQLERAKLHERISAQNDRMSAILKSTRDGVLLLDREGLLVECNNAAERLLGISRDEFIGKNFVGMLFQMMDSNGEMDGMGYSRAQLVELARQLRTQPNRISKREFKRESKNKKTYYIDEIGSPVLDANHRIVGRLLVLRDVTEQKMLSDFREDILRMAVHDLRGPLSGIISGLGMAIDDIQRDDLMENLNDLLPDIRKTMRISLTSAQSLMGLVDSVLDIARLETREMPIQPISFDLQEMSVLIKEMLEPSFSMAEINLRIELPPLPPIYADKDLIRRVLINLTDNALRHTPSGGIVLITAKPSIKRPNWVVISVADSGIGIPPSEHATVFQSFRQVKGVTPLRGSKGSGLGLTFCKLAVEAHEGEIWVEKDSPLSGACICFSLPFTTVTSAVNL